MSKPPDLGDGVKKDDLISFGTENGNYVIRSHLWGRCLIKVRLLTFKDVPQVTFKINSKEQDYSW